MSAKYVLVIDDNPLNVDVLVTLLEHLGIVAYTLESPRLMNATIQAMPAVDLVFLDIEFPDADGFEILKQIKRLPATFGTPVIAYSVHTSEIDRARRAGFYSFLGKPLSVSRFPQQIGHILSGIPVWDAG